MKLKSFSPNTLENIGEVERTEVQDVFEIVKFSKLAQKGWFNLKIKERISFLKKVRDLLFYKKEDISKLISLENGKPVFEVYATEIIPTLTLFDYYNSKSQAFLKPHYERIKLPVMIHKRNWIEYFPYGSVGIISPWNYPLLLPMGQIIPALIAGNAVIFKPSEWTPLTGKFIFDLFNEVNLPEGVFNVIYGDAEIGEALVNSEIDKLFFTGSTEVGKIIAKQCAEKLLPVSCELGGKDPAIVLEDADLNQAVNGIMWGALMNAGQTCVSIERIYVHEKVYEKFIEMTIEKCKNLKGYEEDKFYDYSNIKLEKQLNKIKEHINDALSKGAKILYGGLHDDNKVKPAVIVDVNHSMLVMKEETFGPMIPIQKFNSLEEAVSLANDCSYGLSASIWTSNIKLGKKIARQINAGSVLINDSISYFGAAEAVVGGIKMSGTGRVHGKSGLMEMVYEKYYSSDSFLWQKKIWWFNYGKDETEVIKHATEFLFSKNIFNRLKSGLKVLPKLFQRN